MASGVSVLIPHAGRCRLLEGCLESLEGQHVEEVLVVVPDWAAESIAAVRRSGARAIVTPTLLSFAQASNLAAGYARAERLMLLNDDTVVAPGAIELLSAALDLPGVVLAGPCLLNVDLTYQPSVYADPSWRSLTELVMRPMMSRRVIHRWAQFPYPGIPDSMSDGRWLKGAALIVCAEMFRAVGGFDERFPHGVEDAALALAVRARGGGIALVAEAMIVHAGGASGFRNASDVKPVVLAPINLFEGWLHYWQAYRGATTREIIALRGMFLALAASRAVAFKWLGLLELSGPSNGRRVRGDAYMRLLKHVMGVD